MCKIDREGGTVFYKAPSKFDKYVHDEEKVESIEDYVNVSECFVSVLKGKPERNDKTLINSPYNEKTVYDKGN